jgi:hypothetical protein
LPCRSPRLAALAAAAIGALVLPAAASALPAQVTRELDTAKASTRELERTRTIPLPGGTILYRFQQEAGGVDVLGAETVVDDPPGAPPQVVADSTAPGIAVRASPRIGRARAVAIASRAVGTRGRAPVSSTPAIQPGRGGTLVWRVVVPGVDPRGDFEVLVDAASGEVLQAHSLVRRFRTGHAKLYDPNPVVEHGGFRRLRSDHHGRDTSLLTRLRRPVELPHLDEGQNCLRGMWVRARVGRHGGHNVCKASVTWWRVKRSDNTFDGLMAYYHIDRAQQYIHDLGFSEATGNGIDDRPQAVVADALRQDNSFFQPGSPIKYGSGGVDDSEDADVILHEYGHAMQYSQSPGFLLSSGNEAFALQEGSADYWAAAMSSLSPGTANEDDVCIFDWDATTYGRVFPPVAPYSVGRRCGRRADSGRTLGEAEANCPRVLVGFRFIPDPHCVGEVWSSALWNIRKQLVAGDPVGGGSTMDRIYLASQFMYVAGEHFDDAAHHVLCADEALYPAGAPGDCHGANYVAIHTEMHSRQFVP